MAAPDVVFIPRVIFDILQHLALLDIVYVWAIFTISIGIILLVVGLIFHRK